MEWPDDKESGQSNESGQLWERRAVGGKGNGWMCEMSEEWLDVVDEEGMPTGERVERSKAHRLGIRHRTSHVWILREKQGRLQILLQKRSRDKDSFPGRYDISSAGHIPAEEDYIPSALRELKEELGVEAGPQELFYCGQRDIFYETVFYGEPFRDCQVSRVYFMWLDREPEEFSLQESEVEAVAWFPFPECISLVEEGRIPNCIYPKELRMVEAGVQKYAVFVKKY